MQRNNTPVLLITIVLGVLALGATAFLLMGRNASPPPPAVVAVPTPTPAPRWVATRDIPPRTVINSSMMRQDYQTGAAPSGAIGSMDDIRGQLTREPIGAGQTILLSSFTPSLQRKVPANIPIPNGMRGVAIWVDPSQTAAGLVDVGDHVDVVATHKLTYEKAPRQYVIGATNFTTGRTIGQNLLVLAVDESIKAPAPTPTPVPGAVPAADAPPPPPTPVPVAASTTRTRVLLAAPPEIAARLISANDQGILHVTIRNPTDGDAGVVPEVREYPSRLYTAPKEVTAANKPMPMPNPMPNPVEMPTLPPPTEPAAVGTPMAPPEPPSSEITVIRGTEKTRVLVPQR